ncbi:MAG: hypothetical protein CML16_02240 [Pusillimonas sp.]|nr:hypothetical protein [Pusillimonas sp.]HCP77356.1 hypothetical protein [Pusillimonas sp.]|tara:strand:+ start:958 stop:1323 length:366 start_codon:yes stop_codon:yes gene_type:complete
MTEPFKPFWPKEEQDNVSVGLSDNPKRIDLGKPDAAAVEFAETLQTVATNSLFTRIMLWGTRSASFFLIWIARPLIWWPLKALFLAIIWTNTPNENSRRDEQEIEERWRQQERKRRLSSAR